MTGLGKHQLHANLLLDSTSLYFTGERDLTRDRTIITPLDTKCFLSCDKVNKHVQLSSVGQGYGVCLNIHHLPGSDDECAAWTVTVTFGVVDENVICPFVVDETAQNS